MKFFRVVWLDSTPMVQQRKLCFFTSLSEICAEKCSVFPSSFAMPNTLDFFRSHPDAAHPLLRITDEAEACAAVLMACLRASEIYGMMGENATFNTTLKSRNIFKGRDAAALILTAEQHFEQAGSPAALIDAAMGAIREQTRLPLFFHCLDVILADGVVTPTEHKVFQYLKGKFRVEDEIAWKAMEVLVAKNQL